MWTYCRMDHNADKDKEKINVFFLEFTSKDYFQKFNPPETSGYSS